MSALSKLIGVFRRRLSPTLSSLDAYKLWAHSYPPYPHNALMEIEQAAMLKLLTDLRGRDVLDLACGTGRYGRIARERGARSVIGIDNSADMLRAGSFRPAICAAMSQLPLANESVDVVICGMAVGHLPREVLKQSIEEVARILRRGGLFLFSDFHPYLYLQGGRREFIAPDGKKFAVEHFIYFASEFFATLNASTMIITGFEEPRTLLGGRELPAVLVMRGEKR